MIFQTAFDMLVKMVKISLFFVFLHERKRRFTPAFGVQRTYNLKTVPKLISVMVLRPPKSILDRNGCASKQPVWVVCKRFSFYI